MFTKVLANVSTDDVKVKTGSVCDKVIICETAQAGTTSFQFRSPSSAAYITKSSGQALTLERHNGYWDADTILGYIRRVDADANFDQIELP